MSAIGGNNSLKIHDQEFLEDIAKMSYGSGFTEKSSGGAGYVGAFVSEDGTKIRLTKMLTKSGERSSVAKAGGLFNHLSQGMEEKERETAMGKIWVGSVKLLDRLMSVADAAGVGDEVHKLLQEDLKGDKTLSADERDMSCPALLSRKFLAKAVTTILGAKSGEGGVKTFWNRIASGAKKLSSSGKTTTYNEAVKYLKGESDGSRSVEVLSDKAAKQANKDIEEVNKATDSGHLLEMFDATQSTYKRNLIIEKLLNGSADDPALLELYGKDVNVKTRSAIAEKVLKETTKDETLLRLFEAAKDTGDKELCDRIYEKVISGVQKLEDEFKDTVLSPTDKENKTPGDNVLSNKVRLIRQNKAFMEFHDGKCRKMVEGLKFEVDEKWRKTFNDLLDQIQNGLQPSLGSTFEFNLSSAIASDGISGVRSLNPFKDGVGDVSAKLAYKVFLRLFEKELVNTVEKVGHMPLTELGRRRLMFRAMNFALQGAKTLFAATIKVGQRKDTPIYEFRLPEGVDLDEYTDDLASIVEEEVRATFVRDFTTGGTDTGQAYVRSLFRNDLCYLQSDTNENGGDGPNVNDYESSQVPLSSCETNYGLLEPVSDSHVADNGAIVHDISDNSRYKKEKDNIARAFDKMVKNTEKALREDRTVGGKTYKCGEYDEVTKQEIEDRQERIKEKNSKFSQ